MKKELKRLLSAVLCLTMVLALLPVVPLQAEAATDTTNYVSLPITIRDYAADGMLFEFNQTGATGDAEVGGAAPKAVYTSHLSTTNATASTYADYVRYTTNANSSNPIITYAVSGSLTRNDIRYCVIKYRTNAAASATPQISIRTGGGGTNNYTNLPTDGYNKSSTWTTAVFDTGAGTDVVSYISIYAKLAAGKYIEIAYVAFFTNEADANAYKSNDGTVVPQAVYHQADTANFSMLATTAADYINDLTGSSGIAGTTLIQNGTWGLKTDPDAINATLNSGASQEVYGAWIRTDLVQPTLVNGEMVYTEAAVKYIAEYMQQIMPVAWQNSDGTYNTYHVMGHKLDELGGTDLAAKIRAQVSTGALGTYAAAKAKFDAGNLNDYTQIETWYDAAYFLLHNIFNDNTGYGKTVSSYNKLNLVQTTNADGKTCYVFNSGYDDAVYDTANGVIYNSQTTDLTIAKTNSGTESYVRGNALPEARFDPLGMSGVGADLGYGMSGDTYGDLISDSTADWAEFYDNTNYNLSLEGHAQFIYYEDSDLYFTFTGDDDVYLFINGVRVLDVGAAHSISKVKINLNDVAELCGLSDGQTYDFDFFYMERHGTAANFGIETNIQIVDPSMVTTKTGYQNGVNTGYNGYVNPDQPVVYEFGLQNNGDAAIEELTFTDGDIGVSLTKDAISLNSETTVDDLSVTVYNADGSVKQTVAAGSLTEAKLKELLSAGLGIGEKIVIYGFNYTIPSGEWQTRTLADGTTSNEYFYNVVYTTAVSYGENSSKKDLTGTANWVVQKSEYTFENIHLYAWGNLDTTAEDKTTLADGGSVTLTAEEVKEQITKAGVELTGSETVQICTGSGATSGVNVNAKAVVNSDGSITYTATNTGVDTYYYLVGTYGPVGVTVYTYGVAPNAYVLDYSLPVKLSGDDSDSPLTNNDVVSLGSSNPYGTTCTIPAMTGATSNYGTFTLADSVLTYTLTKIMNDTDEVTVTTQVLENGKTEVTKFTGVEMPQKITTVPASVMYYEDDFEGEGAITYVDANGEAWITYETSDSDGNFQSADQDMNYGSDPNYREDKHYEMKAHDRNGKEIEGKTLIGDASNGTIHVRNVVQSDAPSEIMSFTFQGTGFEILGRTTNADYAVLNVVVTNTATNEVSMKPVICECENGDLYQVPIISMTDMTYGTYKVQVYVAWNGSDTNTAPAVYIDGVRIYSPLAADKESEYYSTDEVSAVIYEVKSLLVGDDAITDGATGEATAEPKAVYAGMPSSEEFLLATGDTVIEYYTDEEGPVLSAAVDLDDYLECGPNNELYLDGSFGTSVIAFYLTPDSNVEEAARTIQIGAHRKTDSLIGDVETNTDTALLVYGSTAEDVDLGTYSEVVASGTEQYYTIDPANLTLDENGRYLVLIGNNDENDNWAVLALTNLKISGYTIGAIDFELEDLTEDDYSLNSTMGLQLLSLRTVSEEEIPDETEPEETEPEETEPEVTEPEETEPEATEPEVTEPEVTEPEETEPEVTEPEATEPSKPGRPNESNKPGENNRPGENNKPTEPEETEPEEEERVVNENLKIVGAELKIEKKGRTQTATLTVEVSGDADSFEILDADGNVLEIEDLKIQIYEAKDEKDGKQNGKDKNNGKGSKNGEEETVTYILTWEITAARTGKLTYTIRALDKDGAVSVNEQTVTANIR